MNHVYAFRIEFACHYLRWSSAKGRGGRMLVLQPDQDTGFDRPTLARIENEIDEAVWHWCYGADALVSAVQSRPWPLNTFPPRMAARPPGAGSASIEC